MRYSGGGSNYTQMLLPDDYLKAIQNAIMAPDFETKQRWAQEVMKLITDKYCLQIMLYCPMEYGVSKAYVRNSGIHGTPNNGLWTPEDAWLER